MHVTTINGGRGHESESKESIQEGFAGKGKWYNYIIISKRRIEKSYKLFTLWLPYNASVLPAACPVVAVHLLNWNVQQQTLGRPTESQSQLTLNSIISQLPPTTLRTSQHILSSLHLFQVYSFFWSNSLNSTASSILSLSSFQT